MYVDNCCHRPKWWKCHNIVEGTDCESCSFNYKTDTNMKSHMIHKHYFKLFHICEGTFSGLEELKKHIDRKTLRRWFTRDLNWGVSDHHKASPDPIFFWKHQCGLKDHNIFMKPIGSIIFILRNYYIFVAFWTFLCLKNMFLDFHQEKLY